MNPKKTNLVLARPGYAKLLLTELHERRDLAATAIDEAAVGLPESAACPPLAETVFGRQSMPMAVQLPADDVRAVAAFVSKRFAILASRANRKTGRWTLHAFALDNDAGTQYAAKLEKAVLAQVKADLPKVAKRYVAPSELAKDAEKTDQLIQIYVSAAGPVWLSFAGFGPSVSPHVGGNLRMRDREGAPSRSARKLEEAFVELGESPEDGDTAVDLGAAPGGWTFALARRGASVTAVDHGALELPKNKTLVARVTHLRDNGLKYQPPLPVDWMCCDMLVASDETLRVLKTWLDAAWMRRFVVNVKLPQADPWPVIREALALVGGYPGWTMKTRHLYHDRREITLMGRRDE